MERRLPETFYKYIPLKGSWAPAGWSRLRVLRLQIFHLFICKRWMKIWLTDSPEVIGEDLKFSFIFIIELRCYFLLPLFLIKCFHVCRSRIQQASKLIPYYTPSNMTEVLWRALKISSDSSFSSTNVLFFVIIFLEVSCSENLWNIYF